MMIQNVHTSRLSVSAAAAAGVVVAVVAVAVAATDVVADIQESYNVDPKDLRNPFPCEYI